MSGLDPAVAVELVRRIAAGEAEAETELVERCGAALRFLTRRFTRDEADAEDLYQETLMVALEKIRRGEVREPERRAGFLRALARNLSIQRYRRRHHAVETPSDTLPEAPDVQQPDFQPSPPSDPLSGLLHRERTRRTRRLLDPSRMEHPRIDEERILDRYLTGRLSGEDEALFEEHLFECSACLEQAEAGEDLRRGLQAVAAEDAVRTTVAVGLLAWLRTRPAVYRGAFAALALALILLPIVLVWQQIALRDARQAAEEAARRAQQQGPPEAPGFTAPLAAFQVISLGVVRDSTADPMTIQPDPQLPRHPPH